jgi:hypothetical protein
MKMWPGVVALVAGYSLLAFGLYAQRRPAVVEYLQAQQSCDVQARRLDAERFEALKRVALLRGSIAKMRAQIRGDYCGQITPDLCVLDGLWKSADDQLAATLAADARLGGER